MSALARLQAKLAALSARQRIRHEMTVPRSHAAIKAELEILGPHISGESRNTSLRRAFLQRHMPRGKAGVYLDSQPLPRSLGLARTQLFQLGHYIPGEPGRVSRRRAALVRAFPDLAGDLARLQLEALGAPSADEHPRISKRRLALQRMLRKFA